MRCPREDRQTENSISRVPVAQLENTYDDRVLHNVEDVEVRNNLVLERLILENSFAVTLLLVTLVAKVLDSLVIEETVGVDTASSNVGIVHTTTQPRACSGERDAGRDVCNKDRADDKRQNRLEVNVEDDKANGNVEERRDDRKQNEFEDVIDRRTTICHGRQPCLGGRKKYHAPRTRRTSPVLR